MHTYMNTIRIVSNQHKCWRPLQSSRRININKQHLLFTMQQGTDSKTELSRSAMSRGVDEYNGVNAPPKRRGSVTTVAIAKAVVPQSLKKQQSIVDFLLRTNKSKKHNETSEPSSSLRSEEGRSNVEETVVKTGRLELFTRSIINRVKDDGEREKKRYYRRSEFPNGDVYEGEWYEDYKDGFGKYTWSNNGAAKGDIYEGEWVLDKRHGEGIMNTFSNDEEYTGQFKDDLMHGKGVLRMHSKDDIYCGTWKEGEKYGVFSVIYDGRTEVTLEYKGNNSITDYKFKDENISFAEFDDIPIDIRNSCLWTDSSSYSIYTFCIFTLLQFDQFPVAFDKWKVLCIYIQANLITAAAQAYILNQLWSSRPYVQDSEFCESSGKDPALYIAILLVFVTQKLTKFKDVRRDIYTACLGRRFYSGDTRKIRNITTPLWARFIAVAVAIYEVAIWFSVLMIGAYYIITTSGVSRVVQAAVSISYITEIDSMAMMYLPLVLRSNKTTFYEVPKMKNASADLGLSSQEATWTLAFPPGFIISVIGFFSMAYLSNCTHILFKGEVSNLYG